MGNFAQAITDSNFEVDVLGSDKPVLVDFWAEWCGPCRMIAPSVEAVAEEYQGKAGVFKMNVDENMNVPQQYGIGGFRRLLSLRADRNRSELSELLRGKRSQKLSTNISDLSNGSII
jgi:thioredoxin 1